MCIMYVYYVCMYVCMHVSTNVGHQRVISCDRKCPITGTGMYVYCLYVYIYVCMYVYMYICSMDFGSLHVHTVPDGNHTREVSFTNWLYFDRHNISRNCESHSTLKRVSPLFSCVNFVFSLLLLKVKTCTNNWVTVQVCYRKQNVKFQFDTKKVKKWEPFEDLSRGEGRIVPLF